MQCHSTRSRHIHPGNLPHTAALRSGVAPHHTPQAVPQETWQPSPRRSRHGNFFVINYDVASPLAVLPVGFYGIVEAGQHVHAQCFAEAPGAGDEHHLDSRSVQYFPDQAGFIDVIASALSDLFARIKQQRIPRRKPVGMRCCFMMRLGSRVSFPCFARSAAALPCLGRLSAT